MIAKILFGTPQAIRNEASGTAWYDFLRSSPAKEASCSYGVNSFAFASITDVS